MKRAKKYLGIAMAVLLAGHLSCLSAYAQPLSGFDSGIENHKDYQEFLFLTGEPILMKGTIKTTVKISTDKSGKVRKKEEYKYSLREEPGKISESGQKNNASLADLSRKITISSTRTPSGAQWIEESVIEKYEEVVSINVPDPTDKTKTNRVTYRVDKKEKSKGKNSKKNAASGWDEETRKGDSKNTPSEFTRAIIYDKQPAINYFAGNLSYRKVYRPQGNAGAGGAAAPAILVDMEGISVGYRSNWGETETRDMTYYISSEDPKGVQGTYSIKTSNNLTKDLEYMENQPSLISFRGGYMISEKDESVLEYSYDINGKTGKGAATLHNAPKFKRLYAPVFPDVKGHWAQDAIDVITAMKAIEPKGKNFGPSLPINREDFAKALVVVTDIQTVDEKKKQRTKNEEEEALYSDVSKEDQTYKYIKSISEKGLMSGVGQDKFDLKGELTNAQAAKILITSLGYESLVPGGHYETGFADDDLIPYWAKDAVYMAKQIGLMNGTDNGYFQPNKTLTRAEAAVLLRDYMNYMSEELREDFRERIMNY